MEYIYILLLFITSVRSEIDCTSHLDRESEKCLFTPKHKRYTYMSHNIEWPLQKFSGSNTYSDVEKKFDQIIGPIKIDLFRASESPNSPVSKITISLNENSRKFGSYKHLLSPICKKSPLTEGCIKTPKYRSKNIPQTSYRTKTASFNKSPTCVPQIKTPHPKISDLIPDDAKCEYDASLDRIIGGTKAKYDEFPWMAIIEYSKGNKLYLNCGGSVISKRYIMTAAHCVTRIDETVVGKPTGVRLGEHIISNKGKDCDRFGPGPDDVECTDGSITIPIEKIIPHPCYRTRINDIALIRLQRDIIFTDFIQPICLPRLPGSFLNYPQNFTVVGWGLTELGNKSDIKLYARIPLVNFTQCKLIYKNIFDISGSHLCAGGFNNTDACRGDSGGPLIFTRDWTHYDVVGIVSFGFRKCGTENRPGIYTNVLPFMDWIKGEIQP